MNKKTLLLSVLLWLMILSVQAQSQNDFSLNGKWQYGFDRVYTSETTVPGITVDPAKNDNPKLWYKREITLPKGQWTNAVLILKGARFLPQVYINGELVSSHNGGMITTTHSLNHKAIKPGNRVTVEIALAPLSAVPVTDASYIPPTDQWRSNCSSSLWDDVVLHVFNECRINSVIPFPDIKNKRVSLKYVVEGKASPTEATAVIYDTNGKEILRRKADFSVNQNKIEFSYDGKLKEWTPETPHLYKLELILSKGGKIMDVTQQNFGIKEFTVKDKQFYLNGDPCKLRGGTVVWHRWVRDEEGRDVGYDTTWFKQNIVLRLKEHGANYIRFHLGVPPEKILDLCDKYGLLVQYEWSFFHGMPATHESLMEQYPKWFDLSMKHPSITLYHPYNETEGEELNIVWDALNEIVKNYPPLVMEERDVIHIHKYWWSLFENLGLYYDNANQFDKAIMVDEFGGNYLDGYGELGGYRSLKESYLRFLGRNSTPAMRLKHLEQSNGKVAEYWRRINAAGVSPFTIVSSWEDGNTWFMGKLRENKPKSVWNGLTVAWSPVAASMNLWDRTFTPSQAVNVPISVFNDTDTPYNAEVEVTVTNSDQKYWFRKTFKTEVPPFAQKVNDIEILMPAEEGGYVVKSTLLNAPPQVKYPVVSAWDIRIFKATIPENIKNTTIFIPDYEKELQAFANVYSLKTVENITNAKVVLLSKNSWDKIAAKDKQTQEMLKNAVNRGVSVLLLDMGEHYLGQGYPSKQGELGPLQGVTRITDPVITHYDLFDGISLTFTEAAEPESHIHPDISNSGLWGTMPLDYTWLWNGLRGGLIVPAADMEIEGMDSDSFLKQWEARGAELNKIKGSEYYAYELHGFYEYSENQNDKTIQDKLRKKIEFMVLDAPALAGSINISTPIKVTDLAKTYKASADGIAKSFNVLANAGKNLTRTPVVLVNFGEGKGKIIMSQLLTSGRLAHGFGEDGEYGIRHDESAVQVVLNMIDMIR